MIEYLVFFDFSSLILIRIIFIKYRPFFRNMKRGYNRRDSEEPEEKRARVDSPVLLYLSSSEDEEDLQPMPSTSATALGKLVLCMWHSVDFRLSDLISLSEVCLNSLTKLVVVCNFAILELTYLKWITRPAIKFLEDHRLMINNIRNSTLVLIIAEEIHRNVALL